MKSSRNSSKKTISFVIPCLNEEKTLPLVLDKLNRLKNRELKDYQVEILVSDNGSTDRSVAIAKQFGARVEHCPIRGYGATLDHGIRLAKGEIIVFADADDTYDFLESPQLIRKLEEGNYDLVMGSRLHGTIHKGAMPFLHRYLGTPVINWILNFLYARDTKVLDANCGFRCFRKPVYLKWNLKSTGMEFASEMLIKSLLHKNPTAYVPVSLYPDKPGRKPHLRTWRDGMRHLLRILLYSPAFFQKVGSVMVLGFVGFLILAYVLGIQEFGIVKVFGLHSMLLLAFFAILGQSIWAIGLSLAARGTGEPAYKPKGLVRFLLHLEEDHLFFLLLGLFLLSLLGLGGLFLVWMQYNFQFLNLEREVLVLMTFVILTIQTIVYTLAAHILKRAE